MSLTDSPLGKQSSYLSKYTPGLLHPISRADNRRQLGVEAGALPFVGWDIWNGYEVSWLNPKGKPRVAMVEFRIPCDSVNIIESKSFKLYLSSLNQTVFESDEEVRETMVRDLSAGVGGSVEISFRSVEAPQLIQLPSDAVCIDELDIQIERYHPEPDYLVNEPGQEGRETLISHLLKSNCPVTGQPDWASVIIEYEGEKIDRAGLLRYIVSFREHQDFHEHCVERIFCDILARCHPRRLMVYARYTRRGGLDINPLRSTHPVEIGNPRFVRQ